MSKRKTTTLGARRWGSNKRLSYGALVSTAAIGVACQGLLGVEDVHQGPPPGAGTGSGATSGNGGSGGSAGKGAGGAGGKGGTTGGSAGSSATGGKGGTTGGSSGTGGDSGEGGSGDTSGNGGTTGGSSGTGGAGGSSGMAGSGGSNAGSAGSAGAVNNDPTVRGKVINHWLHPVPNVPVMIGDATATTDEDGLFEIPDVEATYDAKLVVTIDRYGGSGEEQYGWVYEGLTRRDPTLQVYWGLPLHGVNHQLTLTNPPTESNAVAVTALGGEFGNWSYREENESGPINGVQTSTDWYGPGTVTMTGHGLTWLETNGLPTSFTAYTTTTSPIALADGAGLAMWTLDLKPTPVTSGTIAGTVTSPTTGNRSNRAFVQFTTGASIQLFDHYGSSLTDDFTYNAPTIPGASITVSAAEGPGVWGALGVAHADNLAAGATSIALDIPTAPTITAPPNGTTLSASTVLSWTPGTHDTYVFKAISDAWYEGVFVVTSRTQINMPTFPNGWALRPGDGVSWRVETHGTAQTVDELAGDNGFADAFGYSWGDYPESPRRDSGSFSMSSARGFITAP